MSDFTVNWLYNPVFPTEWTPSHLYELAKWTNGLAFKDVHFNNAGKPVIKIAEIKNGITEQTGLTEQTFSPEIFVSGGDMLFSWSGSPETSIDTVWWRGCEGWLNQHIFKVEPCGQVDRVFFYYILKYLKPQFIQIAKNKQTTGLGHVTVADLKAITVAFPPLPQQRAIARVLGSLDDKIECNRRMNATLEELAQTHFRALMATARTEDGALRDGWREGAFGDIANNPRRGVQPQSTPPETPYIGLEHMPRKSITLDEHGSAENVGSQKFAYRQGEILFGKLRPYFHKVGIALQSGVCSTDILVVAPHDPRWQAFVLMVASSAEFVEYTTGHSDGTRMPRTNWGDMSRFATLLPPDAKAAKLQETIAPLLAKIKGNVEQNRTLAKLRDFLLPRILSGEITAQDALTEAD